MSQLNHHIALCQPPRLSASALAGLDEVAIALSGERHLSLAGQSQTVELLRPLVWGVDTELLAHEELHLAWTSVEPLAALHALMGQLGTRLQEAVTPAPIDLQDYQLPELMVKFSSDNDCIELSMYGGYLPVTAPLHLIARPHHGTIIRLASALVDPALASRVVDCASNSLALHNVVNEVNRVGLKKAMMIADATQQDSDLMDAAYSDELPYAFYDGSQIAYVYRLLKAEMRAVKRALPHESPLTPHVDAVLRSRAPAALRQWATDAMHFQSTYLPTDQFPTDGFDLPIWSSIALSFTDTGHLLMEDYWSSDYESGESPNLMYRLKEASAPGFIAYLRQINEARLLICRLDSIGME